MKSLENESRLLKEGRDLSLNEQERNRLYCTELQVRDAISHAHDSSDKVAELRELGEALMDHQKARQDITHVTEQLDRSLRTRRDGCTTPQESAVVEKEADKLHHVNDTRQHRVLREASHAPLDSNPENLEISKPTTPAGADALLLRIMRALQETLQKAPDMVKDYYDAPERQFEAWNPPEEGVSDEIKRGLSKTTPDHGQLLMGPASPAHQQFLQ